MSDQEKRPRWAEKLEKALAAEYAAGWPFYTDETRNRLGSDNARISVPLMLRAIERAGLKLMSVDEK